MAVELNAIQCLSWSMLLDVLHGYIPNKKILLTQTIQNEMINECESCVRQNY